MDFEIVENSTNADHSENALEIGVDAACSEIKRRHRALSNLGRRTLMEAIELGDLFSGMKKRLPHGRWYPFLKDAEVGARAAQNYIALYRHRDDLLSKSAQDADLTIGASLQMYRLPKPKRKLIGNGTEENIVEALSVQPECSSLVASGESEEGNRDVSTASNEEPDQQQVHDSHVGASLATQTSDSGALDRIGASAEALANDGAANNASNTVPAESAQSDTSTSETGRVTPASSTAACAQ